MSFKLYNLEILYKDMIEKNEKRVVFPFTYNDKPFSCIFLSDTYPYSLYLTTLGKSPITIEWSVDSSFEVKGYIESNLYKLLCKYLDLKYNPEKPFKPTTMLEILNKYTPLKFKNKPKYSNVIKIGSQTRKIEDEDKIFFCGWKSNPDGNNVSEINLQKTELAFGGSVSKLCREKNISSCWTNISSDEKIKLLNTIFNY